MTEQPEVLLYEDERMHYTDAQHLTITIVPRIAAFISLLSSLFMVVAALRQRSRIYHRLMFCLAVHVGLYSVWIIYGPAAVPVGTPYVWGAAGNTATCTTQGFFLQVTQQASYCYYCLMALYSFQAVRNNFNEEKYLWMEKWIHLAVHIWPFGSAFYLLAIESFNFSGHYACWINSSPVGCGNDTGIVCERGPQNNQLIAIIFAGLPYGFILLFPTVVMVALYCEVRRRQSSIRLQANVVAKQAGLYLLALYWSLIFGFVNNGIQRVEGTQNFAIALLAVINLNLNGFWMLLIYLYFRVSPSSRPNVQAACTTEVSTTSSPGEEVVATPTDKQEDNHAKKEELEPISFNIFDGTNAGGAFSQFIFDADSDDDEEDHKNILRWDHDVQKHI